MKKLMLPVLMMFLIFGIPLKSNATNTIWRQQLVASNCPSVNPGLAQDLCYEYSTGKAYVCVPNAGPTGTCTTTGEWKLMGGVWYDNGSIVSLIPTNRKILFGTNIIQGDPVAGISFDPGSTGSAYSWILPNGQFITSGGVLYNGNDAYLNVDRTLDRTSPGTGDMWFNTSISKFIYFNGSQLKQIPTSLIYANTFASPVSSTNKLLFRAKGNLQIESLDCIADTSTSAVVTLQMCSSSNTGCTSIQSPVTCTTTGASDSGITSPYVTSGSYVNMNIGSVTGAVNNLTVTIKYSVDEP